MSNDKFPSLITNWNSKKNQKLVFISSVVILEDQLDNDLKYVYADDVSDDTKNKIDAIVSGIRNKNEFSVTKFLTDSKERESFYISYDNKKVNFRKTSDNKIYNNQLANNINSSTLNFYINNIIENNTLKYYFLRSQNNHQYKGILTFCIVGDKLDKLDLFFFQALCEELIIERLISFLESVQFRTAIISILVDSYTHNISSHSLSALTWWFKIRAMFWERKMYNDKYSNGFSGDDEMAFVTVNNKNDIFGNEGVSSKSANKYTQLGLNDHTNTNEYASLLDILEQGTPDWQHLLSAVDGIQFKSRIGEVKEYIPHMPVSLDFALYPFLNYLTEKGEFWTGAVTLNVGGGAYINLYDLLYIDFLNNPLFLGTIAHSEGVNKLDVFLSFDGENRQKELLTIDLGLMDVEKSYILDGTSERIKYPDKVFELVKLGKDFKDLREKLQSINLYLPGGTVGKHAFYTLIENTLRNVKHFRKDDIKDGIKLHFIIDNNPADDHVSIDIGLLNKHNLKEAETINATIIKKVEEKAKESIIKDGSPVLGGTSQDKLCAAYLMAGDFTQVEGSTKFSNQKSADNYEGKTLTYHENNNCFYKKCFIWRGAGSVDISSKSITAKIHKFGENPNRFKFAFGRSSDDLEKIPFRVITKKYSGNKDNEVELYKAWLSEWLYDSKNEVVVKQQSDETEDGFKFSSNTEIVEDEVSDIPNFIYIHGGVKDIANEIRIRSHGPFRSKFENYPNAWKELWYPLEFIEVVNTTVIIVDNRSYERMPKSNEERIYDKFSKSLNLTVLSEQDQGTLTKLNYNDLQNTNFLVLHLSYIEALGFKEDEIFKFIEPDDRNHTQANSISELLKNPNFKLVIVTGRNRTEWQNAIKDKPYAKNVLSRSILDIQKSIEEGVRFEDDYKIKYDLIQVLMTN